jgi:uncharacterized protein with HEPN domain
MPREQSDASYLRDMLTAAQSVIEFVQGRSFEDYLRDNMLRSAVERQVEIIGEAAGCVSASFQEQHPEVPWNKIIRQRHVLAHHYGEIEHERVWRVAVEHIPELIAQLAPLIPASPPPDPETNESE